MEPLSERERTLNKLHELTAKIQANPNQKLVIIQEFHAENCSTDPHMADVALVMRDIMQAGGPPMNQTNQTEHARVISSVFIWSMVCVTVVALTCIVLGCCFLGHVFATTSISLWGANLNTQSVAVALVFLGVVGFVYVARSVHRHMAFKPTK